MNDVTTPARPRVKNCATCKCPFVQVPADERDAFDLPAIVCTCMLAPACAALAQGANVGELRQQIDRRQLELRAGPGTHKIGRAHV